MMFKSGAVRQYAFFLICILINLIDEPISAQTSGITPGAWRTDEYLPLLAERRVGVVVNQTSLIANIHLVDTLLNRGVRIGKIFTPEHGFRGTADAGAEVDNSDYKSREIPVISLYGNKRKPSSGDLAGLDVVVFDLQDVGVRFYTYISTLHYVMEACAEEGIEVIVLDRPNPNGYYVDGPVLEPALQSFVGMHPVPVVYGMTIGEYAQMINGEYWLADSMQCKLRVITCQHYDHNAFYKLPVWPSPNLSSMRAIYLYPSTAFFEGTIVSEGRGTAAPFQLIGHPDYPDKLVAFTPKPIEGASMNPKLKGKTCYGIDLRKIPLDSLRAMRRINLSYLIDFYSAMQMKDGFFTDYFDLLAGNTSLRRHILQGWSEKQIRESWQEGLDGFKKIRVKYLLYPDY